jgi:Uma2 family endonuclease
MIAWITKPETSQILYPDSDGKPMAENTKQLRWIVTLFGNIAALYRKVPDVFVAADLLWYAVEGEPKIVTAPDVMIVFGRPKGDRGSYRQWEENGIAPQVVFEVLSPGNTHTEMTDKFTFYEEHGVEEYYIFDPDTNRLFVYLRRGDMLRRIREVNGWVSPRLGVRFDLSGTEMVVYGPDGQRFLSYEELTDRLQAEQARVAQAQLEANQANQRAEQAEERSRRLAEKLRQLGVDPDALQGS